jgi:catechol 2,3-dioxygenase-like lactoylglutathione lyase family enzyme
MIGYVTVGSNDLPRAFAFYDALLAELGAGRTFDSETFVAWSVKRGPAVAVTRPNDGKPATVGNGVMVALAMKSSADVDRLYAKAIALGATDEGPAGPRGASFYAGYFRDLDGNKLCAFFMG